MYKKDVRDLSSKHFSRYGEFLASFELAKHGWNVYSPLYDEYIDLVIHKFACTYCNKLWIITPIVRCVKCGKDFSTGDKKYIKAKRVCGKCHNVSIGSRTKCTKCGEIMYPSPTCDKKDCGGEVKMIEYECDCGNKEYSDKIRTIQIKSSRIEEKDGKSKKTYAVDMKPKDMITSANHFFIWCLVDDSNNYNFLIMSVNDFKITSSSALKSTSFFKDQGREHFSSEDFGKWKKFLNDFTKLE